MVSGQSRSQQLSGSQATVLGLPRGDRIVIYAGAPLAGLLLAFGLPWVANWLLQFESFRCPGSSGCSPLSTASPGGSRCSGLGGGLVLGLVFAVVATVESSKLTLTDQQLRIDKSGDTRFLARAEIGAVFLDGKELVLLDRHSRELLRDTHDAPAPPSPPVSAPTATPGRTATRTRGATTAGCRTSRSCRRGCTRCSPPVRLPLNARTTRTPPGWRKRWRSSDTCSARRTRRSTGGHFESPPQ